jgi:hypothetical protein
VDNSGTDPNKGNTTILDQVKKKIFFVDVPKRMAYRESTKVRKMVMGDHKKQYHIIRDYLQTIVDQKIRV